MQWALRSAMEQIKELKVATRRLSHRQPNNGEEVDDEIIPTNSPFPFRDVEDLRAYEETLKTDGRLQRKLVFSSLMLLELNLSSDSYCFKNCHRKTN